MNEEKEKRSQLSRRRILKVFAGLFAFIPAAKYLADASPAFAYIECSSVNCHGFNPPTWECMNPDCHLHNTWYQLMACYDARYGAFCWNEWVDSGVEC